MLLALVPPLAALPSSVPTVALLTRLSFVGFFFHHILFWEDRTTEHHQYAKTKPNKYKSAEEVPDTQSGTQHTPPLSTQTAELETTTVKANWESDSWCH